MIVEATRQSKFGASRVDDVFSVIRHIDVVRAREMEEELLAALRGWVQDVVVHGGGRDGDVELKGMDIDVKDGALGQGAPAQSGGIDGGADLQGVGICMKDGSVVQFARVAAWTAHWR